MLLWNCKGKQKEIKNFVVCFYWTYLYCSMIDQWLILVEVVILPVYQIDWIKILMFEWRKKKKNLDPYIVWKAIEKRKRRKFFVFSRKIFGLEKFKTEQEFYCRNKPLVWTGRWFRLSGLLFTYIWIYIVIEIRINNWYKMEGSKGKNYCKAMRINIFRYGKEEKKMNHHCLCIQKKNWNYCNGW